MRAGRATGWAVGGFNVYNLESARAVVAAATNLRAPSDLRLAALGRMRQVLTERPDIFNLYALMGEVEEAMRAAVEARIRLFGSECRAS